MGDFKNKIRAFYTSIKSNNYIYYIKAMEWGKKFTLKPNQEKMEHLYFIFNHFSLKVNYNLFIKVRLENFENSEYS